METSILDQEQELLDGYRQLKPEARRFIMSTVITAVKAESAVKRQYGLPSEDCQERAVSQFSEREVK